jgi:4'-phosphopantetheinyl transferase
MLAIWFTRTADATAAPVRAACDAVLSADEQADVARRVFERHQHEYRVTRALCRGVLARYLGQPPAALRFRRTAYGRPELDPPTPYRFNLTNTVDLVAIAVSDEGEIGIDTEPTARADTIFDVAATVFTPAERTGMATLSLAARRERALALWTLKEAYMKARGLGFSLPVESFEIRFGAGPSLCVLAPPPDASLTDPDPSRWILETHAIDDHVLAICRERGAKPPAPVELHRADLGALARPGA